MSEEKICLKCKRKYLLSLKYFQARANSNDGYHNICKKCFKDYKRKYYQKNKEKLKIARRKYNEENKEKIKDICKRYREENKEKVRRQKKKYYLKNRTKILMKAKKYTKEHIEERKVYRKKYSNKNKNEIRDKNKEYRQKYKERINAYFCKKRKNDVAFKMAHNLRSTIYRILKSQDAQKSDHTRELLGCSIAKFIRHLEFQFDDKMTWQNYGKNGWHIDHIKPCVAFDLADSEQQKECFNYKNLQPLWEEDNLSKSSRYNGKLIRKGE